MPSSEVFVGVGVGKAERCVTAATCDGKDVFDRPLPYMKT